MLDLDLAVAFLAGTVPDGPWPAGAPAHELRRSPAAARVGRLAADAGYFLLHHEHRIHEVDGAPAEWTDGVLPEPKYEAFRHDLPIGSLHPGHRAKWTAHELAHLLVGFGWRQDASPLFHATAARLAELVPVVLWYFLDEIGLQRCPRHDGPLFRTFCRDCEQVAAPVPVEPGRARVLLGDADRFLEAELAAVARTLRLGRPCPHVWGSLDLCSDGLAYAAAHGTRLGSPAFAAFAERFQGDDPSWSSTLVGLEERVVEVVRAIAEGRPLRLPQGGTARWVARDLGQRLLEIWEQTDGECAAALITAVDGLAAGGTAEEAWRAYVALSEEYELPPSEDVFAVGYALHGVPSRSVAQVEEGLRTVVPLVLELAEDAEIDLVPAFVDADTFVRLPLGERFAAWLSAAHPEVAGLARFEAALRSAGNEPEAAILGPGSGLRLADGVKLVQTTYDPVAVAHGVELGEVTGADRGGRLALEPAPEPRPTALVVARSAEGPVVVEVTSVEGLADPARSPDREALTAAGILVPRSWSAS